MVTLQGRGSAAVCADGLPHPPSGAWPGGVFRVRCLAQAPPWFETGWSFQNVHTLELTELGFSMLVPLYARPAACRQQRPKERRDAGTQERRNTRCSYFIWLRILRCAGLERWPGARVQRCVRHARAHHHAQAHRHARRTRVCESFRGRRSAAGLVLRGHRPDARGVSAAAHLPHAQAARLALSCARYLIIVDTSVDP